MMNKQQRAYALAKSKYQLAKDEVKAYEHEFILRENVRNKDGSVPEYIWTMDEPSEEYFNKVCDKLYAEKAYNDLCNAEQAAFKDVEEAEEKLIDYALSLPMPEGVRQTLSEHRKDWKVHNKLIDLAFRLDTRTVKKEAMANV